MYESPITLYHNRVVKELAEKQDEAIMKEIVRIGVHVDKEGLIMALKNERNQYDKGYQDAIQDNGLVAVVRCKDCKHFWESFSGTHSCKLHKGLVGTKYDAFCSYGERRNDATD